MTANYCHGVDLDLRLVRYAVALADQLHFGRAAARLMIAEQTLSAQIKQLELRLGVELFRRDRRSVALTTAGEVLVERGRRLLIEANDLLVAVGQASPSLHIDVVTEGLTPSLVAEHLRSALATCTVEVTQHHGLSAALPMVISGDLDLAFGWLRGIQPSVPKSIAEQLVRLEPMTIVIPAGHPLAHFDEVTVADLGAYDLLIHTAPEAAEWLLWQEQFIEAFSLRVGRRLHGHGRASANAAVAAYGQPAIGPSDLVATGPVVARPLVDPVPLYPWSAVWKVGRSAPILGQSRQAMHELATSRDWLSVPTHRWWLPESDREFVGGLSSAERGA